MGELVNRTLVARIKTADLPDSKEGEYQLDSVAILQVAEKYSAHWTKRFALGLSELS